MKMSENQPPGMLDGARSIFRGVGFLRRTRAAWPFAAVPVVVLAVLFGTCVYASIVVVAPAVAARLPASTSFLGELGIALAQVLAAASMVLLGFAASVWVTPAVSAPALDRLVELRQEDPGASHLEPASFFAQIACGIRAQALAVVIGAPLLATLWLLTFVAPPLAVVTFPLKLLVVASTVAWGLIDYPLSRRGMRLGERMALLRRGKWGVLGFGAVFAILFAVPFVGILLLPAGVVAATELAVRLTGEGPQAR
jgi:uncharacterized protein involved in cysteine biosynthesis